MYTLSQLFSTAYTLCDAVSGDWQNSYPFSDPMLKRPWAILVKCKIIEIGRLPPGFLGTKSPLLYLFEPWHILNNNLFNIISSRFKRKVEATPPPPWEKENKAKAGCQRKGSVCVSAEDSWQRRKWWGGCVSVYMWKWVNVGDTKKTRPPFFPFSVVSSLKKAWPEEDLSSPPLRFSLVSSY
jgi:hypothetical protein